MIITTQGGKELAYAESEWLDITEDSSADEQQFRIFWDCLAQIAEQAEEKEIDLNSVSGLDFEFYGSPRVDFKALKDVPLSLHKYLKIYF
jgi:hypothetical protein